MERTPLARILRGHRSPWLIRNAGFAALAAINAAMFVPAVVVPLVAFSMGSEPGSDWLNSYAPAGRLAGSAQLYAWTDLPYGEAPFVYRYSPVASYLFAALVPFGLVGWTVLHFAALLALPRALALLSVISFPFWSDVLAGGSMVFVAVAAVLAVRGNRLAVAAFVLLAVMIPRPLMVPVLAYLVWKAEWRTRWIIAAVFALHAYAVLATGLGDDWIRSLTARGADDIGAVWDFGPGRLIGPLWIPIGAALASLLTWRGRLGLASLAASPYWLLQYALMLALEFDRSSVRREERTEGHVAP